MRIVILIAIILLIIQSDTVASKRNHEQKRNEKNSKTVENQEQRDMSLLYGAMKDFEKSSHTKDVPFKRGETDTPTTKTMSRKSNKFVIHRMRARNMYKEGRKKVSDHGKTKEDAKTHSRVMPNHHSEMRAPSIVGHGLNLTASLNGKDLSVRSHRDKISSAFKRYKVPRKHHRHTRKRTKVEEAMTKERQNIAKTIESLDDFPGSFSKGLDLDGMDVTEVTMIDNNTLSDYFHALNDNSSQNTANNNGNEDSIYTPTSPSTPTSKYSWDDNSPSYTEDSSSDSNRGNDDFYDAIENGDNPPTIKTKKARPTKSHSQKYISRSSTAAISPSQTSSASTQFRQPPISREPSQEDFDNFFRGMLDHFGHLRRPSETVKQANTVEVNSQDTHDNQKNVTAIVDGHDGLSKANVKKLVSLGSPEKADETQQVQLQKVESTAVLNTPFSETKDVGTDKQGAGVASFRPTSNYGVERPSGESINSSSKLSSSQQSPPSPPANFESLLTNSHKPTQQQTAKVTPTVGRPQDALSLPSPSAGTRIMGGKISGGQISGGLIEGGHIKAGLIEGGIIKGGQVVGGQITNGTMEGGVVVNGKMLGGHLVDGRLEGGQLLGGNVFGGKIMGGSVEGGDMKGGVVAGGRFRGGSMQGGLLNGGEIQGGTVKGGKVEGGIVHAGNIEGGELKFGDISGGTLKSGAMLGGVLKNGSIDGGTLKGGVIEGGILKGGVMEGGHLKGGLVLAGKIKGGTIEGGVIEGGEIGDGVLITGGKINATIIGTGSSMEMNRKLGELFKQGENSQKLELKVHQQRYHHGIHKVQTAAEFMSDSLPSPKVPTPTTHQYNTGLKGISSNLNVKIPLREGVLKMLPKQHESSDDDDLEKLLNERKAKNENNLEAEQSSQRFFEEKVPDRVTQIQKKSSKHHIVFDGVGFDLPNEDFIDLIDKIKSKDLIKFYKTPDTKEKSNLEQRLEPTHSASSPIKTIEHIKPEDLEMKLSFPTKARSSVTHSDKESDDVEKTPLHKLYGKEGALGWNPKDRERRKLLITRSLLQN